MHQLQIPLPQFCTLRSQQFVSVRYALVNSQSSVLIKPVMVRSDSSILVLSLDVICLQKLM